MAVRRKDARRRRLVIDPTAQLGDVEVAKSNAPKSKARSQQPQGTDTRTYTFGADRRNQRKTTDLIPKRVVSYLGVVVGLLLCLWLINFTALNAQRWAGNIGQAGLDAFAIRGQGSLASWFLSFLLMLTGLASLQIYALRKHRCDDYRGTYRIWMWTAGLLLMASINCVTDLAAVMTHLFQTVTEGSFVLRPWVPMALKLGALSLLLGRGVYEVRHSRGSLVLVAFVWIVFSATAVIQFPAVTEAMVGLDVELIVGNCFLFGTTALFLSQLTYARYIFLDAHGLIVQRGQSVKKQKTAKSKAQAKSKSKTQVKKLSTGKTKVAKTPRKKATPKTTDTPEEVATSTNKTATTNAQKRSKPKKQAKSKSRPESGQDTLQTSKDKSPSDLLKELAEASRAKEQTQKSRSSQSVRRSHVDDPDEHEDVIPMSKSQRRKRRKMEKQRRRAA